MIDLHTHSLFSDGVLIPSELVYRAKAKGYSTIAITDHVDFSNIDFVIPRIKKVAKGLSKHYGLNVIPGAEITYVPPKLISKAVREARKFGAKIVLVHGETTSETVPESTNHQAILAGADILAHPGKITLSDVKIAHKKGVYLEITARKGHRDTNKHVIKLARSAGAKLVFDTDSHSPRDLMDKKVIASTLKFSGLLAKDFKNMQNNSKELLSKLGLL